LELYNKNLSLEEKLGRTSSQKEIAPTQQVAAETSQVFFFDCFLNL
jgi:hypothetical protein